MLSSTKKLERIEMYKFGRANDMLLLQDLFPDSAKVKEIFLVSSADDYITNAGKLSQFNNVVLRPDTRIGEKVLNFAWGKVTNTQAHIDKFNEVKSQHQEGRIIYFDNPKPVTQRFERGGVSVNVDVGRRVTIETCGHGFDGSHLTKGKTVHEAFVIDWNEIRGLTIDNIRKKFQTFTVPPAQYARDVMDWENVLTSTVGYSLDEIAGQISKTHIPTGDEALLDAIKIIKQLPHVQDSLTNQGLNNFIIQGNVEFGEFCPWQLAGAKRFVTQSQKQGYKILPPYSKISMSRMARVNSLNKHVHQDPACDRDVKAIDV